MLIGGTVQCWGYNYSGQLGNGWAGYSTTPVTATGIYPVTWLSSNTSVATVDTKGLATSVSSGTTIITATFGSISASTTLQVDNPNRPPTTNAGPDQTVIATDQAGATVSLSGAGSTDPDGHTLRYIWSGPFGLIGGINPTVSLPLGAHTLTLAVSDGLLSSTDTVVIAVQSMIDLLPTALTTTVSGSNILVQDSVKNQGLTAAGAFTIRYYLSINTSYDAIDRLLCSRSITNLAAGAANPAIGTITTTCAISATLASGSYYVVAVVDADSVVVETNETNNNRSTITPSLIGPDLLFTTLSAATVGSQVAITDTIKNQGNRSAGSFTVRYYLSSDSLYQSTDTVLCSRNLIGLVAGVSSPTVGRTTTTCTTPSLPINLYYVIARVDDGNAVVESLESNNTRLGTRLPIGPDLLPLSISVSKSGSTLTLTYALKNQGTQAAGGFIIRYYLSSDSLYQSTDAVLCRRSLSSLGAGVSSPATGVTTTACTIPSGLAVGAYRVLVRLDSGLTVLETNETNNVKATAVTVSVP